MPKAVIKLAYRQIIDATKEGDFERNVLAYSYEEYKIKSQVYNKEGKYTTFTELKSNDGRANSLHYKSGFAIGGLVDKLNKKIPNLKDALGKEVTFDTYQFEIIESDITNIQLYKVAIIYLTDYLNLFDIIGENLLLSHNDVTAVDTNGEEETFILKLVPCLSITSYKVIMHR